MVGTIGGWVTRHPIWSVLIVLGVTFVVYHFASPKVRTYDYVAQAVDRGEVVRRVTASGKLRALNTIKVGAEVSGQVTRVDVDFNTQVTKGQVLAVIDPTRFRARVEQARASVALAEASASEVQANSGRVRTDLALQEREFGRRQELAQRGFLSRSALDTAAGTINAARSAIRASGAQGARANAQIAQARAELDSAELDLRRATIVAPASGVIINKLVEPGATVAASFQTPNLFEIAADTNRMQVEASVDEADIGQVREGQAVRFTVDSYPDQRFRAAVRQVRKAATETQNVVSYIVVLDVDNSDGRLLPGMTANVEIITGERPNVVRVPTAALRFRPRASDVPAGAATAVGNDATVYVAGLDPYKPIARRVGTGLAGEDFTEITRGLNIGDRVVVRTKTRKIAKEADQDDDGNSN